MKRLVDTLIIILFLPILIPIIIALIILVYFNLGSPVFFKQTRPGKDEKLLELYKFRTMLNAKDELGRLLPDVERLTGFGKFLRSTSLDELPSLWNVLNGDLSLVGPRPLLVDYLPFYNESQRLRHNVRPGITGWAQVNGRNTISWDEKFKLDIWYVENQSFLLDIKILFLTVLKVLRRSDISSNEHVTMEKFKGNDL